jgi:hypothetical protein
VPRGELPLRLLAVRARLLISVLALGLGACGGATAPAPTGPADVSNEGGVEPAPAELGPVLDGPFEWLEESAPMIAALELAGDTGGSAELRVLHTDRIGAIGTVGIVEFRSQQSGADCAVVIETEEDGWYVGPSFWCSRDTSDGVLVLDDIAITARGEQAHIEFKLKADNATDGATGGDGTVDATSEHTIDCGFVDGKPACTLPPQLEP